MLRGRFGLLCLLLVESAHRAYSNVPVKKKTGAVAPSGTGRPRGRPKKVVVDQPKQADLSQQERLVSGLLLFVVMPSYHTYRAVESG